MTDTDRLLERLRSRLGCAYLSDLPPLASTPAGQAALGLETRAIPLEDYPGEAWRQAAAYLFPGRAFTQGAAARDLLLHPPLP